MVIIILPDQGYPIKINSNGRHTSSYAFSRVNDPVRNFYRRYISKFGKIIRMRIPVLLMIIFTIILSACMPVQITAYPQATYDPFEPIAPNENQVIKNEVISTYQPTNTPSGPTPTRVPVEPTLRLTAD